MWYLHRLRALQRSSRYEWLTPTDISVFPPCDVGPRLMFCINLLALSHQVLEVLKRRVFFAGIQTSCDFSQDGLWSLTSWLFEWRSGYCTIVTKCMQICWVRILPLPLCNCYYYYYYFRDLDTRKSRAFHSHALEKHWHLIFNDCIRQSGGYSLFLLSWCAHRAMYEP